MPEPYNYGAQLKAVDPGQAMMQGLATGQQFFQIQQQEEQRQQTADKAQQFQIDFESIIDDKDPRAITDLLIRYPEQREILVAVGGRFSAEEKQQRMSQSLELIGLSLFGNKEAVVQHYEEKADLLEKSGNVEEARNARLQAEQFQEDPDGWRMQQSLLLASQDPDEFLENMTKLQTIRQEFVEAKVKVGKQSGPRALARREAGIFGEPVKTTDADKFQNGLTVYRTDMGETYGVDVNNNILQGDALGEALEVARDYEATTVEEISASRARGRLGTQIKLEPELARLVAAATKQGQIGQELALDAYQSLGKVRLNIGNLNAAIAAVDDGANTGVIAEQFPDWKASTIELRNIQRQLGIDVIGAVTFGALSSEELKLALATALPLNLEGAELKDWLERKRDAQERMVSELEQAVIYFNAGGSLGEYVQMQKSRKVETGAIIPRGRPAEVEQAMSDFDATLRNN
tara:strand:- start:2603 stop:3988 length:1386 start_codon:yes stop_codon:yes gene_type:complete